MEESIYHTPANVCLSLCVAAAGKLRVCVYLLTLIFILVGLGQNSFAATYYWKGGGGSGNTTVGSNWSPSALTSCGGGGSGSPGPGDTIVFDADCDNNARINNALSVAAVIIESGYTGTITQDADLSVGSGGMTVSGGVYLGSTAAITSTGSVLIEGGTFQAPSSTFSIQGDLTITAGTFTHNSGTVALTGTNQAVSGSATFFNLSKVVASAATLQFASGSVQRVEGSLELQGAAGQLLTLQDDGGSEWFLESVGSHSVSYVDVQNSNATGGSEIVASDSNDGGGNQNWNFMVSTPTATPTDTATSTPTSTSTTSPTTTPTDSPSASPSNTPSASPSSSPSVTPTNTPSETPTASPTVTPMSTPTQTPTSTPSVTPSATPTSSPTHSPTASPSSTPTGDPGSTPTFTPTMTPTDSPTATPSATSTSSHTPTPTTTPSATPSNTRTPTTTPAVSEIGIVIEVDSTPIQGVFVEIEATSMPTPRVVLETDENGEVTAFVGENDVVTVRSAMPAISFAPVTESALHLSQLSPVAIEAERKLSVVGMCRLSSGIGQDDLVFSVQNGAGIGFELLISEWRNSLLRGGALLNEQLPEYFAEGVSSFSVPTSLFQMGDQQCEEGIYRLIGREYPIRCTADRDDIEVELCMGEGILTCSSLPPKKLRKIMRRTIRGFYQGRQLSEKLRRQYPGVNRNFSIVRDAARATSKIERVLVEVQKQIATCSPGKRACMQTLFPRKEILTLFHKGFRPRPPKGRIPFRALIARAEKRIREVLSTFPRTIVVCGD